MKYTLILLFLAVHTRRYTCEYLWGSVTENICEYSLTHRSLTRRSRWSVGKNHHGSGCDIWCPNTHWYRSRSPASALMPSLTSPQWSSSCVPMLRGSTSPYWPEEYRAETYKHGRPSHTPLVIGKECGATPLGRPFSWLQLDWPLWFSQASGQQLKPHKCPFYMDSLS